MTHFFKFAMTLLILAAPNLQAQSTEESLRLGYYAACPQFDAGLAFKTLEAIHAGEIDRANAVLVTVLASTMKTLMDGYESTPAELQPLTIKILTGISSYEPAQSQSFISAELQQQAADFVREHSKK